LQFGDIQIADLRLNSKKNGVNMTGWKDHMHGFEQQPEETDLQNP